MNATSLKVLYPHVKYQCMMSHSCKSAEGMIFPKTNVLNIHNKSVLPKYHDIFKKGQIDVSLNIYIFNIWYYLMNFCRIFNNSAMLFLEFL